MPAEKRSPRILIGSLKQECPQDAASLARRLGVSAMAVRQHLYDLEAEGLVTHEAEARPVGRPAKLWRLTPAADRFFPDGHARSEERRVGKEWCSTGRSRWSEVH